MTYCSKCGSPVQEGMRYCPGCGEKITPEGYSQNYYQDGTNYGFQENMNYAYQGQVSDEVMDIQKNKVLAACSYFGVLVLLPLFLRRESPFARFHANQGLVLFLGEIICQAVSRGMHMVQGWGWPFWGFGMMGGALDILELVFLVFSIWGIINVCTGKYAALPIIGSIQLLK